MSEQTVITGVTQAPAKRTYRRRTFKIWVIERILQDVSMIGSDRTHQETTYGQNCALVVIAETALEARELCSDTASGEGRYVWLDRRTSSLTEIGTAGPDEQKSRIVLIDKNEN